MFHIYHNYYSLKCKAHTHNNATVELVGSIYLRIAYIHVVKAEEVVSAYIKLRSLDELGLRKKVLRKLVVNFEVTELEERTVSKEYCVCLIVVLVALAAQTWELCILDRWSPTVVIVVL